MTTKRAFLGHNQGPTLEPGAGWRRYCWTRARADLLPVLPIEVARRRVKRARELGLAYKSYATVRASTGRDIIALLFSSNALRMFQGTPLPEDRRTHLAQTRQADLWALAHTPLDPVDLQTQIGSQGITLHRAGAAPSFLATPPETRALLEAVRQKTPGDAVLLIGDTSIEKSWSETGRLAGYLPAERYFTA